MVQFFVGLNPENPQKPCGFVNFRQQVGASLASAPQTRSFLQKHVVFSGAPRPSKAQAMLKKDDCAILDTQMPAVDQIIGEHPDLARSLVHMLAPRPSGPHIPGIPSTVLLTQEPKLCQ